MTAWTEAIVAHMYPWPIGVLISASAVSLLFGVIGLWALWRVRRLLAAVPLMQERIDSLSHTMNLLTDTTESCFKALSMQLQFMQAQSQAQVHGAREAVRENPVVARPRVPALAVPPPVEDVSTRKARQRRVVGAARRGEAVAAIAAREDLAETEVALRLHLNQQQPAAETKRHGALLS